MPATKSRVKIRPIGDKVVVKRIEANDVTAGGIVLPESAKEKPKRGKIEAIGEGRLLSSGERSKMQVGKGEEVLFTSYAGTEVKIDGEEFLIMNSGLLTTSTG